MHGIRCQASNLWRSILVFFPRFEAEATTGSKQEMEAKSQSHMWQFRLPVVVVVAILLASTVVVLVVVVVVVGQTKQMIGWRGLHTSRAVQSSARGNEANYYEEAAARGLII